MISNKKKLRMFSLDLVHPKAGFSLVLFGENKLLWKLPDAILTGSYLLNCTTVRWVVYY